MQFNENLHEAKSFSTNMVGDWLASKLNNEQSPIILEVSTHFTSESYSCIVLINGGITHPSMRLSRPSRINVVNHVVLK